MVVSHCIYKNHTKKVNTTHKRRLIAMAWRKYEDNLDNLIINIVDDDVAEEGLGKLITFGTMLFLLGTS